MALSDLITRLEREAQTQVDAIAQDAATQVAEIEAAALRAAADITNRHLEHERVRRATRHQRELVRARREGRARELEAHHAQLARILERARGLVVEVSETAAYRDALKGHVEEALSYLQGLRPRVRCRAAFAPLIHPIVAGCDGAELVIDEGVGPGVVAEAANGSVVIDNTLAARFARIEGQLAIELARRLVE